MEPNKRRGKKWWLIRVAAFFVCVYIALVLIRVRGLFKEEESQMLVEKIHTIRLTLADVDESKRPQAPDVLLNDSTVEGIDSNKNYIRDDVELYILDTYSSRDERGAWMQWAKTRQLLLLYAKDKETLKAVMEEGSRANLCITDLYILKDLDYAKFALDGDIKRMDSFVWNTAARLKQKEIAYENMTSYGGVNEEPYCDVLVKW